MDTDFWGPAAWRFLHSVSFDYKSEPTDNDKEEFKNFIQSFSNHLPCGYCREEFLNILKKFPIDKYLISKEGCVVWCYLAHHMVNIRLNKQTPKFEEVVEFYFKNMSKFRSKEELQNGITVFLNNVYQNYKEEFSNNFGNLINNNNSEFNLEKILKLFSKKNILKLLLVLFLIISSNLLTYFIMKKPKRKQRNKYLKTAYF